MKFNIEEREEFFKKYDNVTPYTLDELVDIYCKGAEFEGDRIFDILRAATCGILTLLSTVLPAYMLNNKEVIKQNVFNFVIFGIIVPAALAAATIKCISDYKKDNEKSIEIQEYFDEKIGDIPLSLIEEEAQKRQFQEENNEIYKHSMTPKLIKKIFNVVIGEDISKIK